MRATEDADSERLAALFGKYSARVFGYARRQVEIDVAEEIVSETFLIAWRKLRELPADELPCLLGIARRVIANHRRKLARYDRLTDELAVLHRVLPAAPALDESVVDRSAFLHALESLSALEREALLLTGLDGLSDVQAACVCGCSARTFRVRLHRARKRLDSELEDSDRRSDPERGSVPLEALLEET